MNIKLTPLTLFLGLLLILVISILFSKFLPAKEGFISFADEKKPLDPVFIPPYSTHTTTVVKLYDNTFFDMRNANLIEVDGTAIVSSSINGNVSGNVTPGCVPDIHGNVSPGCTAIHSTVSNIYVLKREEPELPVEYRALVSPTGDIVPVDTPESQISTTSSVYLSKVYDTRSNNTDKYQIVYIAWGTRTYIHVIRLGDDPKHISSYLMGEDSAGHMKMYPESTISVGAYADDADPNNGKFLPVELYDAKANIYQFSKSVHYDQRNGNLVIYNKRDNAIKVYGRNGGETETYKTAMPSVVPVSTFEPWMVNDADNNMVLYMPHDKKTVIAVIQMDPTDSSKFILGKVARFTNDGKLDEGKEPVPPTTAAAGVAIAGAPTGSIDNGPMSEYYKWLAYWSTHILYEDKSSDDYIRKTQIVPPVCPSCPSCPSCPANRAEICTNCGGSGGSGTLQKDGKSIVREVPTTAIGPTTSVPPSATPAPSVAASTSTLSSIPTGVGNVLGATVESTGDVAKQTIQATGDVAKQTIQTTGDVLKTTGSETASILRSAATGATGLLRSAASGAVDIVKSAGSGAADIAKSTGSGAVGLVKSAGSGAADIVRSTGQGAVSLVKSAGTGPAPIMSPSHSMFRQRAIYPQGSAIRTGETQRVAPVALYQGQPMGPSDYYTQYGAVQPKGDTFIPVTADFSAFRK